ncbi:MAG TPA: (d)CMP kinase [Patescibacteria group bacterium]|nr:(d)CMP kinase [Patescibacteria group bacterium]
MRSPFQIAIDGPVAAGKGSVSVLLAKKLGFLYVDTGAMYRASAFIALQKKISLGDEEKIVAEVRKHKISMRVPKGKEADGRLTTVLLDGKDVSWEIRKEEIGLAASRVAILENLREELVNQQRIIADSHDVVMEGRDIGTKVLPNAQLKIYLDAAIETRVERKFTQLGKLGTPLSREEVRKHILDRDTREMTRAIDPLRPAENAWLLDTTKLSIGEVVDQVVERVGYNR